MEHNVCPRCFCAITGSGCACKQSTEVNAYDQLPVGTLLHNRYQVGGVRGGDAWSIEYYGLDTRENLRVTIREFFSHRFAYRVNTQGPTVSPLNKDYDGFLNEFRTRTQRWAAWGNRSVFEWMLDHFDENNTHYVVLEPRETHMMSRTDILSWKSYDSFDRLYPDLCQMMYALQRLHDDNMIHGDICPDNLVDIQTVVFYDGREELSIRLHPLANPGKAPQHRGGEVGDVGVLPPDMPYVALEQLSSKGVTGPHTDVYGLCATIYHMVAGKAPVSVIRRLDGEEIDWAALTGKLHPRQIEGLRRGLELWPKDRIQSMGELIDVLEPQVWDWEDLFPDRAETAPPAVEEKRCIRCMKQIPSENFCPHCGQNQNQENPSDCLAPGMVLKSRYYVGLQTGATALEHLYCGFDFLTGQQVTIREFYSIYASRRDMKQSPMVLAVDGSYDERLRRYRSCAWQRWELRHIRELVLPVEIVDAYGTVFVMEEPVKGQSLRQMRRDIRHAALLTDRMELAIKPIQQIHDAGLVHGNLSPDSIFLTDDGEIRLGNWGDVRYHQGNDMGASTRALPTMPYAAPEQRSETRPATVQSDIYGMCATLFFLLTGSNPPVRMFQGDKLEYSGLMRNGWDAIIERGMSIDPSCRFASFRELGAALFSPEEESGVSAGETPVKERKQAPEEEQPQLARGFVMEDTPWWMRTADTGKPGAGAAADFPTVSGGGSQAAETQGYPVTAPVGSHRSGISGISGSAVPFPPNSLRTDNEIVTGGPIPPWEREWVTAPVGSGKTPGLAYPDTGMEDPYKTMPIGYKAQGLHSWQDIPLDPAQNRQSGKPGYTVPLDPNQSQKLGYTVPLDPNGGGYTAPVKDGIHTAPVVRGGQNPVWVPPVPPVPPTPPAPPKPPIPPKPVAEEKPVGKKPFDNRLLIFIGLGVIAVVLLLALLAGGSKDPKPTPTNPAAAGTQQENTDTGHLDKVALRDNAAAMCGDITRIVSVRFLDTLSGAPADAMDASDENNGTVKMWIKEQEDGFVLCVAAEGGVQAPKDSSELFRPFSGLKHLDGRALRTGNVESMENMFMELMELESVDLAGWDTSRVCSMEGMFYDCCVLEKLDLSHFDTRAVFSMRHMFTNCRSLTELDVTGFDTSRVTGMTAMFCRCKALTELDVSGFDTRSCEDFGSMFAETPLLSNVDGNFDTSACTRNKDFMDAGDTFNGKPWAQLFQ